jgi:hypothetical protein
MTASELKLYLMQKIIKTDNPDLLLKIKVKRFISGSLKTSFKISGKFN